MQSTLLLITATPDEEENVLLSKQPNPCEIKSSNENVLSRLELLSLAPVRSKQKEANRTGPASFCIAVLDGTDVFRLPALGAFGYVELHGLAFLQAPEATRLDG
jgi:hypothetical protein